MFSTKSIAGLLLAGAAGYAYYRYSKMNQSEKDEMVNGLKEKGQKLYEDYVPANLKDVFAKNAESARNNFNDVASATYSG